LQAARADDGDDDYDGDDGGNDDDDNDDNEDEDSTTDDEAGPSAKRVSYRIARLQDCQLSNGCHRLSALQEHRTKAIIPPPVTLTFAKSNYLFNLRRRQHPDRADSQRTKQPRRDRQQQ
jgi:hypothetical protein